jgi:cytochrome c oxidase assembly factor CtaG
MPYVRRASAATVGGLMMIIMVNQLIGPLDRTLTGQMVVQASLLLAAGFLFAYGPLSVINVVSRSSRKFPKIRMLLNWMKLDYAKSTIVMYAGAGSLLAFWCLPSEFDAATVTPGLHLEMQVTLLFAGALIFSGSRFLGGKLRLIAPAVVGKLMGLYGMFLLLAPYTVYTAYPAYEQAYAGVALLVLMVVIDFTVVPFLLYNYFSKATPKHGLALS